MHVLWEILSFIGSVLWFVIKALVVIYLLILVDGVLRWFTPAGTRTHFERAYAPTNRMIVYLQGILADEKSYWPLRDTWLRFANVLSFDYGTKRFMPRKKIDRIAEQTLSHLARKRPDKLTLVLSSMGGTLGLDVWQKIRGKQFVPREVELIVADGICGAKNMGSGGNIAAPIFRFLPIGPVFSFLLKPVMRMMLQPPKDDEIQDGLDKEKVKADAMAAMSPYRLSIWRDQLAYIAGRKLEPWMFDGITRVYYLECTVGNVTIKQPHEAQKWQDVCRRHGVEFIRISVPTPHCAWAQMPLVWNETLHHILDGSMLNA